MRAIFLKTLDTDIDTDIDTATINDENAHHLIKVVRIKTGEELLILDGQGNKIFSRVVKIEKKSLLVQIYKKEYEEKKLSSKIVLAICMPKKEAFFEMIRQSTELGISKIYPIKSQYSQMEMDIGDKNYLKAQKIIEAAMIQSNNPHCIELNSQIDFDHINELIKNYHKIFYFCSHDFKKVCFESENLVSISKNILLLIGPEAGLNESEENKLYQFDNLEVLHLPTPILRAPTALTTAIGYILACYCR